MNPEVDNSPDDKLTEKEALAEAEAQGITFIDEFSVVKISDFSIVAGPFKTREDAASEMAHNYDDPDMFTVSQSRRQA